MSSLPHWVTLGEHVPLPVAAEAFQRMHQAALSQSDDIPEAPHNAIAYLRELRADPVAATMRSLKQAIRELEARSGVAGETLNAWVLEDYHQWLLEASSSEHVAAVASQFIECWSNAERIQTDAENTQDE